MKQSLAAIPATVATETLRDLNLLQKVAATLLLLLAGERSTRCRLEDLTNAVLRLGGTLNVGKSANFVSHGLALLWSHRLLFHLHQLTLCVLIMTQIALVTHENYGHIRAEVFHLHTHSII